MMLNPLTYLKESKIELAKVVWPSRSETIRFTVVVAAVSIIVGIYVAGLDTIFTKLAEAFLYK